MTYKVHIRHNATGEVHVYKDDYAWPDVHAFLFQWQEGNYSCDCNRHIFFVGDPGDDHECGETAYAVTHAVLPDGTSVQVDEGRR